MFLLKRFYYSCAGIVLIVSGLGCSLSQAQVQVLPLSVPTKQTLRPPSSARTAALTLPFFDDFSLAKNNTPDPLLWLNTGTFVSNTNVTGHPSLNVVTFDGLKVDGTPYVFSNPNAQDSTDALTALPIDLSVFQPRDSLYLSFFWQARGLSERPDVGDGDSLRLQLLTNGGLWRTVWVEKAQNIRNTFTQVMLPIRAQIYLHGKFQFRFQAFGRQSGQFDAWHLDYVYLNRGRRANDLFVKDISVRRPISPFLKRYWAMPLSHYRLNPAAETADSVRTDITNLFNNNNFTTFTFSSQDTLSRSVFQRFSNSLSENIPALSSLEKRVRITPIPSSFAGSRAVVKYKFDVLTTDDQNPSIPGINLRRNDTLSAFTTLDDFYAYDDGTPEYQAFIKRLDRAAVRFVMPKQDNVSGLRVNFTKSLRDIEGQSFVVQLYDSDRGKPGKVVYQRAFRVTYPKTFDGFVEYKFDKAISVKDTFYLGWFQLNEDFITIGLDKNTPQFRNQIFYNAGSEWVQNTAVEGSLLLRPVIGGKIEEVITGLEPLAHDDVWVAPNPTNGPLVWQGGAFSHATLTDMTGRIVLEQELAPDAAQQINIALLPAGLYVLYLSDGQHRVAKKIVKY